MRTLYRKSFNTAESSETMEIYFGLGSLLRNCVFTANY